MIKKDEGLKPMCIEPRHDGDVFYIDFGDMDPEEALAHLQKVREEYLKKKNKDGHQ